MKKILYLLFFISSFAYSQGVKISQLPSATALTGPELFETVQGGINKKVTATQISTYALSVGALFWPLSGPATLTGNVTIDGAFGVSLGQTTALTSFNPQAQYMAVTAIDSLNLSIGGSLGTNGQVLKSDGTKAIWGNDTGTGSVNSFPPNIQSGNYTLQQQDTVRMTLMRSASAQNLTIPSGMKAGSTFQAAMDSTGILTLVLSGVTAENPSGSLVFTSDMEDTPVVIYYQNSTHVKIWKQGGAGSGWATTGTTNVINPTINVGAGTLFLQNTGQTTYFAMDGTAESAGIIAPNMQMSVADGFFEVTTAGGANTVHLQSGGGGGADLAMTTSLIVSTADDISLTAGTGAGDDISLTASVGHINLTGNVGVHIASNSVAITDGATMDITSNKHTLTTASATRTFTQSYLGDYTVIILTLNTTSCVFTFPAGALCKYDGTPSGDNTLTVTGVSGDKHIISILKNGTDYYVAGSKFAQ